MLRPGIERQKTQGEDTLESNNLSNNMTSKI